MIWMQQLLHQVTPFLLANGILMGLSTPTLMVSAYPKIPTSGISAIAQVNYNPPPNGSPGHQSSGGNSGSRPSCPQDARLVSLSPVTNWGKTIDDRPTFLLYFSAAPAAVEFSLWNEQDSEKIYDYSVSAEPQPGLFKFRLPDDAPELEVDRLYRWQFQVSCNSSAAPQNEGLGVDGVIVRRSNPELSAQIESVSPQEKVELYAENGLWYDTLNELLKLRCAAPEDPDLAADWASLLEHPSIRLNELVEEPIDRLCVD